MAARKANQELDVGNALSRQLADSNGVGSNCEPWNMSCVLLESGLLFYRSVLQSGLRKKIEIPTLLKCVIKNIGISKFGFVWPRTLLYLIYLLVKNGSALWNIIKSNGIRCLKFNALLIRYSKRLYLYVYLIYATQQVVTGKIDGLIRCILIFFPCIIKYCNQ